jgi:rubredoxin
MVERSGRASRWGGRRWPEATDSARCPNCGGDDIIPVMYGLPTTPAFEAAERGELHLGGCMPYPASRHCRDCETDW